MRSIGDALAQSSPGGPRLLVRVAAGVYRERLRAAIPVTIEAWPAVRPGLQHGVSCWSFGWCVPWRQQAALHSRRC